MSGLNACRIAITGTPGCGKTSLTDFAANHSQKIDWNLNIQTVKELAKKFGHLGDVDENDGAQPIDVDALAEDLRREWTQSPNSIILVDGHLSHHLPVDAIVIIRCHPDTLRIRMGGRDYHESKIEENVEWELIGSAWNDSHEWSDIPILELDSTASTTESLFAQIESWMRDGFKPKAPDQRIDWIAVLHGE
ncbi:MAG: AAA family ATPase [Euryarchaeota archaeon]|jgi:adenylate kinase|nr:AAA family ATPase [Euryarchaeota archaeon]